MAIKKIKLENFQSHVDTEITLSEGLTVILGPTDQGKSAIIRALKWVLYNEPRGSDFITVGCKSCRVSLEMTDGTIITRERDGNKNRYILKKENEEQIFEGFGVNVPAEIIQAHGIPKIQIDTDKSAIVNLAEQLDPPFLISESGGNKAKALGRLIGIHILDAAQRSTLRDLTETQQHYKALDKDIEELKKELAQYDDLPLMEKKLNELKDTLSLLEKRGERYIKLYYLREKLILTEREIDDLKSVIGKFQFIDLVWQYTIRAESLALIRRELKNIQRRLSENKLSIDKETKILSNTEFISQAEAIHNRMDGDFSKLKLLIQIRDDIQKNNDELAKCKSIVEKNQDVMEVEAVLKNLISTVDKFKEFSHIRDKIKSIEKQISKFDEMLCKTSQIVQADSYLTKAQEEISRLNSLKKLRNALLENDASINKGNDYINKLLEKLSDMTIAYSQLLKRLAKCPTCLSPIDQNTAKKILSELMKTTQ